MPRPVPDVGLTGRLNHCHPDVLEVAAFVDHLPTSRDIGLSWYTSNNDPVHRVQPSDLCQIAAKLEESTGTTEWAFSEPLVQVCPSIDIHSLRKFC